MAKFIIVAEESALFQYEIEAETEMAASEIFYQNTACCSGKFIEALDAKTITVRKAES